MHEFRVEKMNCGGCARRVTQTVQALDQAAKVDIDLRQKIVRVDSAIDAEAVANAITRAGYPATSLARA